MEEAEGVQVKPDRKSVLRILERLAQEQEIFVHTVTLGDKEVVNLHGWILRMRLILLIVVFIHVCAR